MHKTSWETRGYTIYYTYINGYNIHTQKGQWSVDLSITETFFLNNNNKMVLFYRIFVHKDSTISIFRWLTLIYSPIINEWFLIWFFFSSYRKISCYILMCYAINCTYITICKFAAWTIFYLLFYCTIGCSKQGLFLRFCSSRIIGISGKQYAK